MEPGGRLSQSFERLTQIGSSPSDTEEQRAYKSTHIVMSSVTAVLVLVWTVLYGSLGLVVAAVIPLAYSLLTLGGLVLVARTKKIRLFRTTQITMWLTFPFLLQWVVGGFVNGSAVGMWAIGAPLLASTVGAIPRRWFAGFVGLAIVSGLIDGSLAANAPSIPQAVITSLFVLNFLGITFVASVALGYFIRGRERALRELALEQAKSEELLLNILPAQVADRLKAGETVIADRHEGVTVLFADLVGSTPLSERLSAGRLVELLNDIVSSFDDLSDRLGLEKIKIVGDSYVVVGGLPLPRADHAEAVAEMALAMRRELRRHSSEEVGDLRMRYGIHTGSVVAGVIGKRKFSYDLYGDTVNTASRMESNGLPDEIQVTEAVYLALRDRYEFEARGLTEIKGKGMMPTYLLRGAKESKPFEG